MVSVRAYCYTEFSIKRLNYTEKKGKTTEKTANNLTNGQKQQLL